MDSNIYLIPPTLCRGAQCAPVFPFSHTFSHAKTLRRGDRPGRPGFGFDLFHKTTEFLLQSQQFHDTMHPSRNKNAMAPGELELPDVIR